MSDENGGKANGGKACGCSCICDPTVARGFDQTSMRYNDRSAYASNNQQDTQVLLLSMFQAQAQNALEQTPANQLPQMMLQLVAALGGPVRGPATTA